MNHHLDGAVMDALDAGILRELGIEPFAGIRARPRGLRATDVARVLGRSVRLVQDRITRMETTGVIAGYALVPNPRHLGLRLTTLYVPTPRAADAADLARLADVDGFVFVVAYLGEGLCVMMSHENEGELRRRVNVVRGLVGSQADAKVMYTADLPPVERGLSPLDWRIIASLAADARRPLTEVAHELGVTAKTVRNRLARMREEGSVDDIARLDFGAMEGLLPFEIAVWCDDVEQATLGLVERLRENHWLHFLGPPDGYCDVLMRVFTTNAAGAHGLVRLVERVPGVREAKALMAAGAHADPRWLQQAIRARVAAAASPERGLGSKNAPPAR
jgi:DNA-binding Lrp family transcriptional regulator